ncbi:hypothetical protein D3C81_1929250 [compost metagenome]
MAAGQHGIEHDRQAWANQPQLRDQLRDDGRVRGAAGNADLHGMNRHLVDQRLRLPAQQFWRHRLDAKDPVVVLHR